MFSDETLNEVFDKTDGRCHLCRKQISFSNYGIYGTRGAWHIEHSIPRAKGGTDHFNNLLPACISCNLEKGTTSTKTVRSWNGFISAPLSRTKKEKKHLENIIAGGFLGGCLGVLFGPKWALAGGWIGAIVGIKLPVE
jgi:hypothetical protein